ncbi:MAG TPA: class I SAM-dependent methyltransferase [Jatrophihabitans sp.]|nr:class I SAM-dependent methyltransferase [Jatrophihabitans sp.]
MSSGSGRGVITADGCAVEVYLKLPALGEAEIVHQAAAAGATVLDLGAGAGRITHRLVELGHDVVAVDQSADMLAHVYGAETVCAPIAGLDLRRRFDAVLMASHLVNTPDESERRALLEAAARHVAADGVVVVEWHPPGWFDTAVDGVGGVVGEVRVQLCDVHRNGDLLDATVRYWSGDELWTQTFTARRLDDEALHRELRGAGLSFDRWLRDDHTWFAARPAS